MIRRFFSKVNTHDLSHLYKKSLTPSLFVMATRLKLPVSEMESIYHYLNDDTEHDNSKFYSYILAKLKSQYSLLPEKYLNQMVQSYTTDDVLSEIAGYFNARNVMKDNYHSFVPKIINFLSQTRGESCSHEFIDTNILSSTKKWKSIVKFEDPMKELDDICLQNYSKTHDIRLLSESGRNSPFPIFVVGVFVGGNKLGEGFGNSLAVAQRMAREEALYSYYKL